MSLWNPNAFSITGQPLVPEAPPALRVQGGPATPQQLAMAQQAFASFCAQARLSAAPNPTQIGRLPDGSPYRIVVFGNTAIMELQVDGPDDLPRRSGIGLSLTTLDGGLVPGHIHENGLTPQPYILTPEVLRGTRKCTGKWRVRKVDGYNGGKAVWGNKAGARFSAGVGGVIYDIDLIDHRSLERIFGTNNRAYWAGEYADGTHIYRDGEKILGSFRDRIDTLPFFRRRRNGELWAMQITPGFFPEAKLQLWGERFDGGESTATIGELLDELAIPPGYSMLWQTISVSPDGDGARMMMRKATGYAVFARVDLSITDAGMAITSMADSGDFTTGGTDVTTTGDQGPNGTFTRTVVNTPGWVNIPGGYGYDAKGGKTDFQLRQVWPGNPFDRREHRVEVRTSSGTDDFLLETLDESVVMDETFPHMSLNYGDGAIRVNAGSLHFILSRQTVSEYDAGRQLTHRRITGGSSQTREDSFAAILFVDPLTDLYITHHFIHDSTVTTTTDYTYADPPGGAEGVTDNSTETVTHSYGHRLIVKCRGVEVLRVDTPLTDPDEYTRLQCVASSATDPLTGAVCVNVLEIDTLAGSHAPPLRSWIILADDRGAKMLHEVMDVPESTAIRVKKDYALLSVV